MKVFFGGFIWSHIKLQELDSFIDKVNDLVLPGRTIVLIDNNYVEGNSTAVIDKDEFGNTYQKRKLKDGSTHLVLKNFPTKEFTLEKLKNKVKELSFTNFGYYWILIYSI